MSSIRGQLAAKNQSLAAYGTSDTSRTLSISRRSPTTPRYEQWTIEGSLTAEQRANRVWKKKLAECQDPGIDPAQDEAMLDFIARRKAVLTDTIEDE